MKKLFGLSAFLALVFALTPVAAAVEEAPKAAGYTVQTMVVEATLSTRNVLTVSETLTLQYGEGCTGAQRVLPTRLTLARTQDGQPVDTAYAPLVADVLLDGQPVPVTSGKGYLSIPLAGSGDALEGQQTYRLSYTYDMGQCPLEEYDDVYYSFTGGWMPRIEQLRFSFTLPKTADLSDLRLFTGALGSLQPAAQSNQVSFSADGLTVSATAKNIAAGQSLSLYLKLPTGYFRGARTLSPLPLVGAVAGLLAVGALLVFLTAHRGKPYIEKRRYPPEDLNAAEAGYILNRGVGRGETMGLLLWLAQNGNLRLHGSGKNLVLEKAAPLPANAPAYLASFYSTLFAGAETVAFDDIARTIAPASQVLQSQLPRHFRSRRRLQKPLFAALTGLLVVLAPAASALAIGYTGYNLEPFVWLFAGLYCIFAVGAGICMRVASNRYSGRASASRTIWFSASVAASVIAIGMAYFASYYAVVSPVVEILLGILGTTLSLYAAWCWRPTAYAAEHLNALQGLMGFMQNATRQEVGSMLEQNRNYCYELLPYAYLFGLEAKWSRLMDELEQTQPAWYDTPIAGFTVRSLTENTIFSLKHALRSSEKLLRQEARGKGRFGLPQPPVDDTEEQEIFATLDSSEVEVIPPHSAHGDQPALSSSMAAPGPDPATADAHDDAAPAARLEAGQSAVPTPPATPATPAVDADGEETDDYGGEEAYANEGVEELPPLEDAPALKAGAPSPDEAVPAEAPQAPGQSPVEAAPKPPQPKPENPDARLDALLQQSGPNLTTDGLHDPFLPPET